MFSTLAGGAAYDVLVGHVDGTPARSIVGDAFFSRPRACVGVLSVAHAREARAQGGFHGGSADGPVAEENVQGMN